MTWIIIILLLVAASQEDRDYEIARDLKETILNQSKKSFKQELYEEHDVSYLD